MSAKQVLIVDDSKSARVALSQMLERFAIGVDMAESAEEAIEYLQKRRPDAIFMDHQMPGMDGLQAVKIIKNDPRTATIPIMMYTSQEGELYVGQARALGAVGVLPKQVAPADVSKVLFQLHLLQERRDARPSALQPVAPRTDSTGGDEAAGAAAPLAGAAAPGEPPVRLARRPVWASAWMALSAIATVALVLALALLWSQGRELEGLRARLGAAEAAIAAIDASATERAAAFEVVRNALQGLLAAAPVPAAAIAGSDAALTQRIPSVAALDGLDTPRVLPVGYGEAPFAGARLDALRALAAGLEQRGASGVMHVTSYTADFCLAGNASEGYSLAPDDLPARSCDLTGNPHDDSLRGHQRESRAFAEFVAALPGRSQGTLSVVTREAGRTRALVAYPTAADTSAAQWNATAGSNQRVEISFTPRPPWP